MEQDKENYNVFNRPKGSFNAKGQEKQE